MGRSRLDLVSSLIKYGYDDDMVVTMQLRTYIYGILAVVEV
jgi:hypothetical protein